MPFIPFCFGVARIADKTLLLTRITDNILSSRNQQIGTK